MDPQSTSNTITSNDALPTQPRDEALKQKFAALKQLSDLNDSDFSTGVKRHPDQMTSCWPVPWVADNRIKKANAAIDEDVDRGEFGIVCSRVDDFTPVSKKYLLYRLQKGDTDSIDTILTYFGDYYPRDDLVVIKGMGKRSSIYYHPLNRVMN